MTGGEAIGSQEAMHDVAIDVSAIKPNSGGVRRYAHELIAELGYQNIRPLLLARSNDTITAWPGADRFIASAPADRVRRLVWEQTALVKTLKSAAPDIGILHSPHYTMPGSLPRLVPERVKRFLTKGKRGSKLKHVVTIHDLSYFTRPQDHSLDKRALFTRAIAKAAKSADALICVSERTAQALHAFVDVSAPVFVAPHGIDHGRFHPLPLPGQETPSSGSAPGNPQGQKTPGRPENGSEMAEEDRRIRKALGVEGDYILSLSAIEPRKNLAMLIRAYEELLANDPSLRTTTLVIGGEGWPGIVQSLPTATFGRIIMTGFVSEVAVAPLFRGALCVAYPSLEEGFGLPALEALACGAPVVTTIGSVMHDLMGDAAIAVQVDRAEPLAVGLRTALEGRGPALTTRLAKAQTFTWTNSALSHAVAYRSCR